MSSNRSPAFAALFATLAWILASALTGCAATSKPGSDGPVSGDDALVSGDDGAIDDAAFDDDSASFSGDSASLPPGDDGAGPPASDSGTVTPPGDTGIVGPIDTGISVAASLAILPSDTTVTLAGGKPAVVDYYTDYTATDGSKTDVTAQATFTIDDTSIATFSGRTLTATKAGSTTIHAAAKGLVAATKITVVGPVSILGPGAPTGASGLFGGAVDPSRAPSFVYPSNGIIVPPNMNVLELHFLPGTSNTLFELSFFGPNVDVKVYFTCIVVGSGCVYSPDPSVWTYLAEGGRGQGPITYKLRGVNGASPGAVGVSASQTISFGLENLAGGIYYWNAGAGATIRYEFGVSGKTGETYLNAAKAGASTCVGCHVLSRDGTRISVGLDIPAPSPYKVFDVASLKQIFAQGSEFGGGSNFFTFSPDSKEMMTSNGISIVLRDATNGGSLGTIANVGAMPDWSGDGGRFVFAKPSSTPPCIGFCGQPGVDAASIELSAKAGGAWPGTSTTLVPYAGQNNYYPSFSPDGSWVVFNRSPSNANSFDAKDAEVWLVSAAGGKAIQLATASTGGDSWAKWTPSVQRYRGGSLLWLTFSSRRAYGLRLAAGAEAQLWMTAIDPAKAAAGADGSYPAFWLPFQDLGSGNHIAQWVTHVARQGCGAGLPACPSGQACRVSVCVPTGG